MNKFIEQVYRTAQRFLPQFMDDYNTAFYPQGTSTHREAVQATLASSCYMRRFLHSLFNRANITKPTTPIAALVAYTCIPSADFAATDVLFTLDDKGGFKVDIEVG